MAASFNRPVHGARGLFSIMVYLFHVINSGLSSLPLLQLPTSLFLLRGTEYGVELFFCISGFVICGTLRRASSPSAFLEDRVIRIFPALWATILVIAGIGLMTDWGEFEGVSAGALSWWLPVNLLALPGILPVEPIHPAAWSLSYEMCFYLACAALWSLRMHRGTRAVWVAAPLAALMLAFYPRGIFLLSGVLVAEGMLERRWIASLARAPLVWLVIFLVSWHEIQMLTLPRHIIMTTLFAWAGDFRLPLAVLGFMAATLAFAGIAASHGILGRFLGTRPMQYMGTISYSFYLWHPIVMSGVKLTMKHSGLAGAAGGGAQALFLVLALPPSLLAAHASQSLFERKAGSWLRRRLHHPISLQSAAANAS